MSTTPLPSAAFETIPYASSTLGAGNLLGRGVLAVDLGTTICKAVVFDPRGSVIAAERAPTPLLDAGAGRSEIDMEALWRVAVTLMRKVAASGAEIAAIGLSGTAGGAWLISADGKPVRSAILWNDGRAAGRIAAWQADGVLDRVFAISGNVVFPGYTAAVIRWLEDNEPETLDRAAASFCCKDWIRFRLTGNIATDPSDAAGMPYDTAANRFSREIWDLCGIGHRFGLLPAIVDSGAEAGRLLPSVAEELGLAAGTPVVTGVMDVAAAMLGAGAVEPGDAGTILGTSCLDILVLEKPALDGPAVGVTMPGAAGGFLRAMVNTAGTTNLDWFLREIWKGGDLAGFEAAIAQVPVGARGLLYHPYLSPTGLVSPFVHPHARAQFFGLSIEHCQADMGRAVIEGVALAIRDCFAAMPQMPERLRLIGGGSRSPLWCQIIADCLGIPTMVTRSMEPGAWGGAMLALAAAGLADLKTLVDKIEIERVYEPDAGRHRQYSDLFGLYHDISTKAGDHWTMRAEILRKADKIAGTAAA